MIRSATTLTAVRYQIAANEEPVVNITRLYFFEERRDYPTNSFFTSFTHLTEFAGLSAHALRCSRASR
jgi:hypothetical protein